jgi:hypothetical protein
VILCGQLAFAQRDDAQCQGSNPAFQKAVDRYHAQVQGALYARGCAKATLGNDWSTLE